MSEGGRKEAKALNAAWRKLFVVMKKQNQFFEKLRLSSACSKLIVWDSLREMLATKQSEILNFVWLETNEARASVSHLVIMNAVANGATEAKTAGKQRLQELDGAVADEWLSLLGE